MEFLQQAGITTDLTTYTFSNQNFGTASADRYIIVSIQSRDTGTDAKTIDSVTVGGISATISVQGQGTSSGVNSCLSGIAIAAVPTGTSGDVVVTFSQGMLRCSIALYSATGINATPTDTGSSVAASPTYDIDVSAGGFAIGGVASASSSSAVWTGITEDYDTTVETFLLVTGASETFVSVQTNLTLTATITGTNDDRVGVFASWGLAATTSTSTTTTSTSTSSSTSTSTTVTLPYGFIIDTPGQIQGEEEDRPGMPIDE